MAKIRWSKRSDVLLAPALLALAACAAPFATSLEVEDPAKKERHPDGVLLEPSFASPEARDHAVARDIVVLKEPVAPETVRGFIRDFLGVIAQEDQVGLSAIATADAHVELGPGQTSPLVAAWRERWSHLDFSKTAGADIVDYEHVEYRQLDEIDAAHAFLRTRAMREGDLVVFAPIATPRVGNDLFFGDAFILLLRWDANRWRIAEQREPNAP